MRLIVLLVAALVLAACGQHVADTGAGADAPSIAVGSAASGSPERAMALSETPAAVGPTGARAPSAGPGRPRGPNGGLTQVPAVDEVDLYAPDRAENLSTAFESAYDTNPSINRARANVRAADEAIAIAKSGNRPTVTAELEAGLQTVRDVNVRTFPGANSGSLTEDRAPSRMSLNVSQPLFRGFRTRNAVRQAEANVRAERERLRATQQQVFQEVAISYVDIRRARRAFDLRAQEVSFLDEQVASAIDRQRFGEGTRTDIDQAQARLAEARAILSEERASLAEAEARFRELTGLDPGVVNRDIDATTLLPATLDEALRVAQDNNPTIHLAVHEADEANFQVKSLEGETLPTVSLNGRLQTDIDNSGADRTESAEVRLVVQVPIYQAGRVSAQVRQAKESLGGARIGVDLARNQVRSDVVSAWSAYRSALDTIVAANLSVAAAERALAGVLEELRVGQRTTIDVLNAQRDLITAQITQVQAIRQRDGAAFVVLRAMGELDIDVLGIDVNVYNPAEHHAAVKDKWRGLRTPDGR